MLLFWFLVILYSEKSTYFSNEKRIENILFYVVKLYIISTNFHKKILIWSYLVVTNSENIKFLSNDQKF